MNTAQLIVVSYAALAIEGVLLFLALQGSAVALIVAILVAAAFLVYFLKPHPMARKPVVVGVVVLPFAAFAAWYWGWGSYEQWRTQVQADRQAGEWARTNIPDEWQRDYRQKFPRASGTDMVDAWFRTQEEKAAAEKALQEQATKEAAQKVRIAARLKVGDRVWVQSGSSVATSAGVYFPTTPRLFGTIVGTDFPADRSPSSSSWVPPDRYAVKLDEALFGQVVWASRDDLHPAPRK